MKAVLRQRMRAWRQAHDAPEAPFALRAVLLPRLAGHDSIGAYLAMGSELSLDPVIEALRQQGRTLAAPRLEGDTMHFVALGVQMTLAPGARGFREPPPGPAMTPACLLMPLLAVDPSGNRLGRGAGHYDRWLARQTAPLPRLIGIAFDGQVVETVPAEPHDVPLDAIATPSRWIDCRANRPAAP